MVAQLPDANQLTPDDVPPPTETLVPVGPAEKSDEDPEERIELVRTGLVRIWVNGKRFRLRRPFFGELKKIRLALEDVQDELADAATDAKLVGEEMIEERQEQIKAGDEWTAAQRAAWEKDKRAVARKTARELMEHADVLRLEWFEQTWRMLSVDGVPDEWPSWLMDPRLPDVLLGHWRAVPLGRG